MKFDPIKNAVILDTETIGIGVGSPVHEVALYDVHSRSGYQFLIEPNYAVKLGYTPGVDSKRMTTSGKDYMADFFRIGFESGLTSGEAQSAQLGPEDIKRLDILKQLSEKDAGIQRIVSEMERGVGYSDAIGSNSPSKMARQIKKAAKGIVDSNNLKIFGAAKVAASSIRQNETKAKNITTLMKVYQNADGGKGRAISWGDTIVAKAIYTAELDRIESLGSGVSANEKKQEIEKARVRALQAIEEMVDEGGIGKVLTREDIPEARKTKLLQKVARGDSFFFEKVMKPLGYRKDGTRDLAQAAVKSLDEAFLAYPYLAKIFDQSIEGRTIQEKMASPLLSNLEKLAVAENVSLQELITGQSITMTQLERKTAEVTSGAISFTEIMRGKAIWIANANFESKIFGSHAMALEAQFTDQGAFSKSLYSKYRAGDITKREFIDQIQAGVKEGRFAGMREIVVGGTSPYTADMFTVSNPQISEAKAKAMVGFKGFTFRSVFRAYRDYMRGGDVGDILDIVKAHQSYLIGMGPTSTEVKKPLTLSVDVAYRLYRAAEVGANLAADESDLFKQDKIIKALFESETHRAIEDTPVEDYVLKKSYGFSSFYEDNLVHKKNMKALYDHTVRGAQAREAKIFHYLYNRTAPEIQKMQFEKRLLSAAEDINRHGFTIQTTGVRKMGTKERLVPIFDDQGRFSDFEIKKVKTSYLDQTKGKVKLSSLADVVTHIFGDIDRHSKAIDPNYAPILSALRKEAAEELSDAELLRNYVNDVFRKMDQAGLVSASSDTSIAGITGPGNLDVDNMSAYQMQLSHRTNEIMGKVAGLTEEEVQTVVRQQEILHQAKNATPPPPPVSQPVPTVEPPKVTAAQPSPTVKRVVEGGVLEVFDSVTDLRYDRVLGEAGKVNFSQEDSIRGLHKTFTFKDKAMARMGGKVLGGMALVGAAGAFLNNFSDGMAGQKEGIQTLRTMNYQKWLSTQKDFYGMSDERRSDGMGHNGILSMMRKVMTDFGSPYQGPEYSFTVFEQQKLLKDRENYLRMQFGIRHYTEEGNIGRLFSKIRLGSLMNTIATSGGAYDNYNLGAGVEGNFSLAGIRRDANLVKLNLEKYRIEVSDADTIVLKRRGPQNGLTSFFGMNEKPISIRLAGIDAPETAHGDRKAQPFAMEAKSALQAMLNSSRNVSVYVDRNNVTYGRQVGHIIADDKNLSLELLRRGYVSYLPFRGKGVEQSYDMQVFNSASKLAQGNNHAMWGNPYFQAYSDVVKRSGKTITFNTLVNTEKVSKNANLMNLYSLMNYADQAGMYNSAMAMEAASIGSDIREKGLSPDYKSPIYFGAKTAPHKSYQLEMLSDMARMMESKGGRLKNKLKIKQVSKLNKSMAIDSTGGTNSIYSKRKYHAMETYGVEKNIKFRRRQNMARGQKDALRRMRSGPIGHHRM